METQDAEKHTPYFEVLDSIREAKGCPLCHLETDRMRRYLDGILYEFVNDPGVRAGLARSKGFCQAHAHLLLEVEGPRAQGIAILYRDQVEDFLKFLHTLKEPEDSHFWQRKKLPVWQGSEPCPACRLQCEQRLRFTEVMVRSLKETEFEGAFARSAGLCVPHFILALELAQDRETHGLLITIQETKFADLKRDLEEFCRKNDYRFRDEGFGEEGDSWLRAVRMLGGEAR